MTHFIIFPLSETLNTQLVTRSKCAALKHFGMIQNNARLFWTASLTTLTVKLSPTNEQSSNTTINSSFLPATNNTASSWRSLYNLYKYLPIICQTVMISVCSRDFQFTNSAVCWQTVCLSVCLSLSDSLSSKSQGGYQETLVNSEQNQWTVSVTRSSWTCSIIFPFERSNEEYRTRRLSWKTNSVIRDFQFHIYRVIHKSLRDFRTRLCYNQDTHGRKGHINRQRISPSFFCTRGLGVLPGSTARG